MCDDKECKTCLSRTWIIELQRNARKRNEKVPKFLVKPGSPMCRREGINYSLQCMECLMAGVDTNYHGISSRSGRQHHQEHQSGLENGSTSNPLVMHSVEQHGGIKHSFLAVVTRLEPSAMYRTCRESVQIAGLPDGPRNMNRCIEWGRLRVPVLAVTGGDPVDGESREPGPNPRPDWSAKILEKIKEGGMKRIRLWISDSKSGQQEQDGDADQSEKPPRKKGDAQMSQERNQIMILLSVLPALGMG